MSDVENQETIETTSEVTQETTQETTQEKTEAQKKSEELRQKQAGYYSRNPDELTKLMADIERMKPKENKKIETKSSDNETVNEIRALRNENALKDAIIEYNLSKDDIEWIKGSNPDEIRSKAEKFVEYKKSLGTIKEEQSGEDEHSPTSSGQYVKKNITPVGSKPQKKTLEELESSLLNSKVRI